MAKDEPSYAELRAELTRVAADPGKTAAILEALPDGGDRWMDSGYADLRWSLTLGHLDDGQALFALMDSMSRAQGEPAGQALQEFKRHRKDIEALLASIAAIMDGSLDVGAQDLETLLKAKPLPGGLSWVGKIWVSSALKYTGDLTKALHLAREALEIARDLDARALAMTQFRLGELYHAAGYHDQALSFLTQAEQTLHSLDARRVLAMVLLAKARVLSSTGESEPAMQTAAQAHQAYGSWEAPLIFMAWLALAEGDPARAEQSIASLTESGSPSQELVRVLSLIRLAREDLVDNKVVSAYVRLRSQPPDPSVDAELEALSARAPDFLPLQEQLAWNMLRTGRLDEAAAIFDRLVSRQLEPYLSSSVLLGLACLANRTSQRREAGARLHAAKTAAEVMRAKTSCVPKDSESTYQDDACDFSIDVDESDVADSSEDIPGGLGVAWRVGISGDLGHFALADLVQFLSTSHRSGTLMVTSDQGIGAVHLLGGKITGAISPACPSLGRLLIEARVITEKQLGQTSIANEASRFGRLSGTILMSEAGVDIQDIREALTRQVIIATMDLLGWTAGRFSFEPDRRTKTNQDTETTEDIQLDVPWVLLEAYRQLDEAQDRD